MYVHMYSRHQNPISIHKSLGGCELADTLVCGHELTELESTSLLSHAVHMKLIATILSGKCPRVHVGWSIQ